MWGVADQLADCQNNAMLLFWVVLFWDHSQVTGCGELFTIFQRSNCQCNFSASQAKTRYPAPLLAASLPKLPVGIFGPAR